MVDWETIEGMKAEEFRRLTGVKQATFKRMVEILKEAHCQKKARGGRPNKLSIERMLLMTLEYLREYRTYFHIGNNYGVSESYAYKLIRWVENTLINSGLFKLPGRKALLKSNNGYATVLMDVSETPIERPKKNSVIITQAKRSVIR